MQVPEVLHRAFPQVQETALACNVGSSSLKVWKNHAGQEGELIQRWVLLKARAKAPMKRLWISSLTEEAIKEGFDNLKDGEKYFNLFSAGQARAIGDWLLGMNATRLFTKKFAPPKTVLSIGRVQTPTLAMIVQRQKEINAFIIVWICFSTINI